jgi:hypothetical protein
MTETLVKYRLNIISIIVLGSLIFIGGPLFLHTLSANVQDKIANGLLADFLVTFPVLYYFIIVRPLRLPAKSVLLILSIAGVIAYVLLPPHQRQYLLQVRKLTALAELAFIIYAVTKFNKIRSAYNIHRARLADPVYNLRAAMTEVFGDVLFVRVLSSELAILRYSLFFWRKEKMSSTGYKPYTTHREAGYIALWCALLLAVLVETIVFHLLIMKWNNTVAIVFTVFSAYGILFLVADLSGVIKRRVYINNETLMLRTGLRWRINTKVSNISSIQKITNDYHSEDDYYKGGILKNSGNVLITFKDHVVVERLYGAGKICNAVLMNIDDFDSFSSQLCFTNDISI